MFFNNKKNNNIDTIHCYPRDIIVPSVILKYTIFELCTELMPLHVKKYKEAKFSTTSGKLALELLIIL